MLLQYMLLKECISAAKVTEGMHITNKYYRRHAGGRRNECRMIAYHQ
jgi:hypothetical protein